MTLAGGPAVAVCLCGHVERRHNDEDGCLHVECGCTSWRPGDATPSVAAVPDPEPADPTLVDDDEDVLHQCPEADCSREFSSVQGVRLHQRRAHEGFNPTGNRALTEPEVDTLREQLGITPGPPARTPVVEAVAEHPAVSATPVPSAPVVGPPAGLTPDAEPDRFAVTFFDANATRIELHVRDARDDRDVMRYGETVRVAGLWSFSPGVEPVGVELDEDEARALAMALITAFGGVKA